jgi:very-short-patch-repair endonuclease
MSSPKKSMGGRTGLVLPRMYFEACGLTQRQFLRPGMVHVAHNQWLNAQQPHVSEQTRLLALGSTLPDGAVISHDSAAALYGLPASLFPDGCLHISLTAGEPVPQRKELVVHSRHLPPDDHRKVDGLLVTTPERTFLDLAASCDRERLVVIGDAMLRAEWTTKDLLLDRMQTAYRVRGVRVARSMVPLLDAGAQSPPESVVRLRMRDAGLPAPATQLEVQLDDVTVHIDLGYDAAKVGIEYEGAQHAEQYQFGIDIDRYSALAAHGWLILRAGRRDLGGESRRLIGRTRSALRSRGVAC